MEKAIRGILLLTLCIMMSSGRDAVKNGKSANIPFAENRPANRIGSESKNLNLDTNITKDICYIRYSVETRRSSEGKNKEQEIAVIRVIRK